MTAVIKMEHITKSFSHNQVLKDVDFTLEKGTIHALLGENGTGKSTLMNILTGLIPYDSGQISIQPGMQIAFIHQELSLVNDLSVYENLFLGSELRGRLLLNRKKMIAAAERVLKQMGVSIDPTEKVAALNSAMKQVVEISRAVLSNKKIVIMDEPTASLTDDEITGLFKVMRRMKDQGISIIFISHKLKEVLEICDSFTVMRNGYVVESGQITPQINENYLIRRMVGKQLYNASINKHQIKNDQILELEHLSRPAAYSDVSLTVRQGEVVGLTGLLGSGGSEILRAIIGAERLASGTIKFQKQLFKPRNTAAARKSGIAYIPKNRKENGILPDMTVKDNILVTILKQISRGGLIGSSKADQLVLQAKQQLAIKYSSAQDLITSLSGGNQQKVLLARALSISPKLVVLDNPTQGVDIAAKAEIYDQIENLTKRGVSFILASNEFDEIKRVCDRVYVLYQGRVQKEFQNEELDQRRMLYYAMGGDSKQKERSEHYGRTKKAQV